MRICRISTADSSHAQEHANFLVYKGYEVHLISPSPMGIEGYTNGIKFHFLKRLIPQIWSITRYLSGLLWLIQIRRLVSRIKPDILDAHGITVNGYLAVASGFHPLVLTALGSDILIDAKQNVIYKFLTKQALKRADCIVCCSSALKEETIQLGVAPDKIEVVFMGTDTKEFSPAQKDTMLLQRLGISDTFPVVISTRTFRPVYDVETLIKAIPLVLEEVPEARFIIVGQGEQRSYLEGLAQNLGISDSVKFVGWVSHNELSKYLTSSDVYVSTSLSDGTSICLLEAMACELAPVVTAIPANQPWIKDGENGFLIPVRDHKILATRITFLIKNVGMRREFGKIGRQIVQKNAEYETEMAKLERIYQGLVEKVDTRGKGYEEKERNKG